MKPRRGLALLRQGYRDHQRPQRLWRYQDIYINDQDPGGSVELSPGFLS